MNFGNTWVEIISTGRHVAKEGQEFDITLDFLEQVVRNHDPKLHEAPAVIGHPATDAPAYGWAKELRLNGDRLEVRFSDVDPAFEQLVKDGRFKKRSASFYLDTATAPGKRAPYLRHVGFLGAQPPAVKGLRDIQFAEGESLTFESANFCEGATPMKDDEKKSIAEAVRDYLSDLFGKGKTDPAPASFSESDRKALISEAVEATTVKLTASFTEQIKERDTKIDELTKRVDSQVGKTTRAELASFVEKLPNATLPPALRPGLVSFMEVLGAVEPKLTIISFEEKDGETVERKSETTALQFFQSFLQKLGPIIEFGEVLGGLSATAGTDPATIVTPERMNELREKAGLPAKEVTANA